MQKTHTLYECSTARNLWFTKKTVLITGVPLFVGIMAVGIDASTAAKLNSKRNQATQLCVAVIATSWPLILSKEWEFGTYSIFHAIVVACFTIA